MYINFITTVNREIFVVKIFSDSMASVKIMHIINDNAVWGRLSENYLTRKFIARNICDLQYVVSIMCMYMQEELLSRFESGDVVEHLSRKMARSRAKRVRKRERKRERERKRKRERRERERERESVHIHDIIIIIHEHMHD